MRVLALETSEYVSSLALWDEGRVVAESFPSRMDLCEKLTARIEALLGGTAGSCAPAVDALAVSQGPGSFTGLRVGMATAKTLAHVWGVPLVGIPTQEAIAAAAEVGEGECMLVLQQARRDHVYAGVWVRTGDGAAEVVAPHVVPVAELGALLGGMRLITGPATDALGELVPTLPDSVIVRQAPAEAATVACLAADRVSRADPNAAFTLQPLYLLASQAERMKGMDLSGQTADAPRRRLRLRRASPDDLPDVVRIENASFSSPWSEQSLREELSGRIGSHFLIAELDGQMAGYMGTWMFAGEAHICTIAVDPQYRRCGIAEMLMLTMLQQARDLGNPYVILEYRIGNTGAAALYEKLGFVYVHRRRGYYQDTNEDAIVAAIPDLEAPDQCARLQRVAADWRARHDHELSLEL